MPEKPLFIDQDALGEIRANAGWREVFGALGIQKDEGRSRMNDWWAHSPFSADETPFFHMGEGGLWYCFSTGQGGGVIELVQAVRGVNCYEAARWLVENGLSRRSGGVGTLPATPAATREGSVTAPESAAGTLPERAARAGEGGGKLPNQPIRQNLVPLLEPEHEELDRRGIAPATCAYLGCGYLPEGGRSPLAGRIVFQVRGVAPGPEGRPAPVVLTHIGRALTAEQEAADGKWHLYAGFQKSLEIYNIDKLVLDGRAAAQARASGHVLLVEGCFDVAKLVEAGILNAGATFGAHLGAGQLPRLQRIAAATGVKDFRIWYDRDPAGTAGQAQAVALVNASGDLTASGFDWEVAFPSPTRGLVKLPETVTDPGEFSGEQLRFLREHRVI